MERVIVQPPFMYGLEQEGREMRNGFLGEKSQNAPVLLLFYVRVCVRTNIPWEC